MAVNASSEAIREMKKSISETIRDIEQIKNDIKSGMVSTSGWDDVQAERFRTLMQKMIQVIDDPVEKLSITIPKLERMAEFLDNYGNTMF